MSLLNLLKAFYFKLPGDKTAQIYCQRLICEWVKM